MSAKELQRRCDDYHKKVIYLESKLKDVVKAYKGLESEKRALEEVLCAKADEEAEKEGGKEEEGGEKKEPGVEGEEGARQQPAASCMVLPAQATVESLKKAFSVLVKEKIRVESALKNDKKFLLTEVDALKEQVQQLDAKCREKEAEQESLIDDFTKRMQKSKEQMKMVKSELERERDGHGTSMAALQAEYAAERRTVENLNKMLAEAYTKMHNSEELPTQFKKREKDLKDEIAQWKRTAEQWQEKATMTPTVQLLQDQIANLKVEHQRELQEAVTAAQAKTAKDGKQDSREDALEASVQRLAAQLAAAEAAKQEREEELRKAKEREEAMNQQLERLKGDELATSEDPGKRLAAAVAYLKEKRPEADVRELLDADSVGLQEERAKYDRLKEEFEKYKLKAEAVLKSKQSSPPRDSSEGGGEREEDGLRLLVTQLHDKLRALEVAHSADQASHDQTTQNLRERISELERSEEMSRNDMRRELASRVSEMEAEMARQRERTLDVLAEKERELEATRSILVSLRSDQLGTAAAILSAPADPPQALAGSGRRSSERRRQAERKTSAASMGGGAFASSFDGAASLHSLVEQLPHGSGSGRVGGANSANGEHRNIFYEEELSKKEREIADLRASASQLDYRVREAEQGRLCRDLQMHEQTERLKEEIRVLEGKLALALAAGGGDSQYLRNIFVQFLHCEGASARKNILKAMGTVLKLSAQEMKAVDKVK